LTATEVLGIKPLHLGTSQKLSGTTTGRCEPLSD